MKKKSMLATMAGAMVAGLGMVSTPAAQQVIEQTAQNSATVVQQQANQQRTVRSTQQQAQRMTNQTVRSNGIMNPYVPFGGGGLLGSNYGMTPKEYGEYLMRTGKDKYNKRCRKHWAKARS